MYAVIETGGKQYRVEEGQRLRVEKLPVGVGEVVTPRVLMLVKDEEVKVGTPEVAGARVELRVLRHGKQPKIVIFKYKPKKNYRRKQGHRQLYTEVLVSKIES
ncbi:50S ribosomal protein L21 [Desulfothermobacter acidiphilus]|uniref:50S ribosomal protein L21 n=1 Tax=Desulfothermobacter acidiphilus TaxID=1938353 RepID=UPI003F892142